jgi:hypothetical protein
MTFLGQIRTLLARHEQSDAPRIAVFGDSHTAALLRARDSAERAHLYEHIRVVRLLKEKHGRTVGEADLARFCEDIRRFRETDFVFSAVGGNQYAVVSTVQEPVDFDFLQCASDQDFASDRASVVPHRAIVGFIEVGVRGNVGPMLREIRNSTRASVYHLAPPPPKEDNAFISKHFESRFAEAGLMELGPTRPRLRLKCWQIQLRVLKDLCEELGITLILPPGKAVTSEGYLAPIYYAKDVTHANRRYGEMVLKQILKITGTLPWEGEGAQ